MKRGMPNYKKLYCPILKYLAEASSDRSLKEIRDKMVDEFNLSEAEQNERYARSRQKRFENRIGWAVNGLRATGLLERPARGKCRITAKGKNLRADDNEIIEMATLAVKEEWKERKKRKGDEEGSPETQEQQPTSSLADIADEKDDDKTPEERIEEAYEECEVLLAKEVLETIAKMKPEDFERLAALLLEKMGYGEIEERIKKQGPDGGIDGIINQDALGLERVYTQAKRWNANPVPGKPIRDFGGALSQLGAKKGVFVTNSTFAPAAKKAAENCLRDGKLITLIDGQKLAELMIKYKLGVVTGYTYEIKKLDENFFADVEWETIAPEATPIEETQ